MEIESHYKIRKSKGDLKNTYDSFQNLWVENNQDEQIEQNKQYGLSSFDTEKLSFDCHYPNDIIVQKSYDGSVNLIMTDNLNPPRLINSRFTVRGNNTYEVVDRNKNTDTNIYKESQLISDISLYKTFKGQPVIMLDQVDNNGELSVGNYVFYIRYSDEDNNESDFAAESGIVSCFIGNDGDPFSINGGIQNMNSNKSVTLEIKNVDTEYEYIFVYYTRSSSDPFDTTFTTAYKVLNKYAIKNNNTLKIRITGNEPTNQITLDEINVKYFVADRVKTQAIVNNRLFLANLSQKDINHKLLSDLSLRFIPKLIARNNLINNTDENYNISSDLFTRSANLSENRGYYSTKNIYNYVGYWPKEIYRFGIVYIYSDNQLSPVFNIRGMLELSTQSSYGANQPLWFTTTEALQKFKDSKDDWDYYVTDDLNNIQGSSHNENSKGVVKFNGKYNPNVTYAVQFCIEEDEKNKCYNKLIDMGITGFFFVRQKRIPTTLAQVKILPIDKYLRLPLTSDKKLESITENIKDYKKDHVLCTEKQNFFDMSNRVDKNSYWGICPDYELRQAYYNNLFTGTDYILQDTFGQNHLAKIIGVQDGSYGVKIISGNKKYNFKAIAGDPTDASKFETLYWSNIDLKHRDGRDANDSTISVEDRLLIEEYHGKFRKHSENEEKQKYIGPVFRGMFGPYLGIVANNLILGTTYDIKIPDYSEDKMDLYFQIRYDDQSEYRAISHRYNIDKLLDFNVGSILEENDIYRGDCYYGCFSHRINRNFQDPEAPNNDVIIDAEKALAEWDPLQPETLLKLNRGDINAVKLGSWETHPFRSTLNICVRSEDNTQIQEKSLTGQNRTFYPLSAKSTDGNYKIPESSIFNLGFGQSMGEKWNFITPDIPYIKNNFENRIIYSNIAISGGFQNGFRIFNQKHYRDWETSYGAITKILEFEGKLAVIFEHGISVNSVGGGTKENAQGEFLNTDNVLPFNPTIINGMYGSTWKDSIIKTNQAIYGVDTTAKKIWKLDRSLQFTLISDLKVQKFLNENIRLSESDKYPIIAVKNVKTHWNAYKNDIMFTFYNETDLQNQTMWNLCYNEPLDIFTTFYSWIPSFSENINNIFFSFDRETSKMITGPYSNENFKQTLTYDSNSTLTLDYNHSGYISNIEILPDRFGLYKKIITHSLRNIEPGAKISILFSGDIRIDEWEERFIIIKYDVYSDKNNIDTKRTYTEKIFLNLYNYEKYPKTPHEILWQHGNAGIFDLAQKTHPTKWYGKQHPFEFEFLIMKDMSEHKIFNDLVILGNNAEPESFHFQIKGDVYEFSSDKENMYFRQEATKALYQYLGSDINYDLNIEEKEEYLSHDIIWDLNQNVKSTLFPCQYFSRQDTYNNVYDNYKSLEKDNYNYDALSGAEIVKIDDDYGIENHVKAKNIEKVGRLRGNMQYKEDRWFVQINPLILVQKNEKAWSTGYPPIVLGNSPIPEDIKDLTEISDDNIPNFLKTNYNYSISNGSITADDWGVLNNVSAKTRSEAKLKDKYMKVRIRYTGFKLAIIQQILTYYTKVVR